MIHQMLNGQQARGRQWMIYHSSRPFSWFVFFRDIPYPKAPPLGHLRSG